jgi:hypothetical protein
MFAGDSGVTGTGLFFWAYGGRSSAISGEGGIS